MRVSWISPDPEPAYANFICAKCQLRVNKGEPIYLAKQNTKTVKICEECAESVEIDREVSQEDRESWLGEDF